MRKGIILFGIIAFCGISKGQTIPVDDFDYFVGCFDRGSGPIYTEFAEWRIIKPDASGIRSNMNSIEYAKDKHWVYCPDPLIDQCKASRGWTYRQSSRGYEYYILIDLFGHERQSNVLTVWEHIGRDSLRFYCGQTGDFDSFIGSSKISQVRTFPDSSTLLVVQSGGEGYSGYSFFRGTPRCDFQQFYEKRWDIPIDEGKYSYSSTHYNFEHMRRYSYKATEVSEFITIKQDEMNFQISVDSAKVRVIDLWDMAQKAFRIE